MTVSFVLLLLLLQDAVRTEVERGPVKVIVELVPARPRLSDEPTLTITIEAAEGVKVTPPPFGGSVGGFLVRDFREPLPEVRDGLQIIRQIYRLEPVGSGEQVILPIPVKFNDGKDHVVETESLVVRVTSMVGDEVPTLAALRGPAGPVALEGGGGGAWIAVALIGAVAAAGVGIVAWRRRRRPADEAPRPSPTELAHLELQKLLEDNPLDRGDYQTFYVELTGVVRRFIERTTGLRAPEQTTEEFLRVMQSHPAFGEAKKRGLKAFLESADLVKFAGVTPSKDDVEAGFRRAREFVGLAQPAEAIA